MIAPYRCPIRLNRAVESLDQADFDLSMIRERVVQPLKCVIHKLRQRLASL